MMVLSEKNLMRRRAKGKLLFKKNQKQKNGARVLRSVPHTCDTKYGIKLCREYKGKTEDCAIHL